MGHSISTFALWTKTAFQGERGEVINTCEAYSLTEAIIIFSQIKQLKPDQLVKLFRVHEKPRNVQQTT